MASAKKTSGQNKPQLQPKAKKVEIPRPWLEHYPPGVSYDGPLEGIALGDLFDQAVSRYGSKACFDFFGTRTTYAEIGAMTNQLAAGLQKAGVEKGTHIGLLLPNCPYYSVFYFAILKLGAVVVNFNPLYTKEEIREQVKDSDIEVMVTLDLKRLFDKVAELTAEEVIRQLIVCPFTDLLPPIKSILFRLLKSSERANLNKHKLEEKLLLYPELTDNDGKFKKVEINPEEDIALLQYTGGTTGIPKGAMLTHANLTINCEQIRRWFTGVKEGEERFLAILPFFHVFAMSCIQNFGFSIGAEIVLMPKFEIGDTVGAIRRTKPTILPGVPTLYTALLEHKGLKTSDFATLRYCISGGAPLPHDVRKSFEDFAGCRLVEGYGLSETSPVASINPFEGLEKENSIGQPVPGTSISIRSLDDPSHPVGLRQNGEICISGPQVMSGYWNKPGETADTFTDEYFRTGDVGYMDEHGFVFIVDRIKDMINCSGFKVYPRRVEDAIYEHPAVAEVTVIGVPDEYRGETPKAFIRLKSGMHASEEDIRAVIEPKLSKIERPEFIEFRDELPKTMVGKLSKKELREESENSEPGET
ncbi:MAG: long-chain-fatty-acid--CoA ligase [Hyphomicrobiales bacterium]